MKTAEDALHPLDRHIADCDQGIAALKATGDAATEDDLKAARHARDQGWLLVRGLYVDRRSGLEELAQQFAPDGRIADAYECQVREADQSVDLMRAHVRESTELSLLRGRKADLEVKRTAAAAAVNALGAQRDVIGSEWRALWPAGLITVQLASAVAEGLDPRGAAHK